MDNNKFMARNKSLNLTYYYQQLTKKQLTKAYTTEKPTN